MKTIPLSDLETLAVGLFALVLATAIVRRVPLLARLNVPTPVIGGLLVAVLAALLYQFGGTTIQFANQLTDFLLLAFLYDGRAVRQILGAKGGWAAARDSLRRYGDPVNRPERRGHPGGVERRRSSVLWLADRKRFIRRRTGNCRGLGQGSPSNGACACT